MGIRTLVLPPVVCWFLPLLALSACGKAPTGSTTGSSNGSIKVVASTINARLAPAQYGTVVDGGSSRAIPADGSIAFDDIAPGSHSVRLEGVPSACSVKSPTEVNVVSRGVGEADFVVVCAEGPPSVGGGKLSFTSQGSIYVVNLDGTGLQNLGPGCCGDWSPDGSRIAFHRSEGLFLMNADGSNITPLVLDPGNWGDIRWSPDGTRITSGSSRLQILDIYRYDLPGSGETNLTRNSSGACDDFGTWYPSGQQILFEKKNCTSGRFEDFYRLSADGSGLTRIAVPNPFPLSAALNTLDISPDGRKILFGGVTHNTNEDQILIMNTDGTNVVPIATRAQWGRWSPDGVQIIYSWNGELSLMNADGSNVRRIPLGIGGAYLPAWKPR